MPAHRGVSEKLYPCSGSQIPWSQMINMNIRPPRLSEARKLATLPAEKARIRKRESLNIGSFTLVSTKPKKISTSTPPKISASTFGLVQPMECPPYGRSP